MERTSWGMMARGNQKTQFKLEPRNISISATNKLMERTSWGMMARGHQKATRPVHCIAQLYLCCILVVLVVYLFCIYRAMHRSQPSNKKIKKNFWGMMARGHQKATRPVHCIALHLHCILLCCIVLHLHCIALHLQMNDAFNIMLYVDIYKLYIALHLQMNNEFHIMLYVDIYIALHLQMNNEFNIMLCIDIYCTASTNERWIPYNALRWYIYCTAIFSWTAL